MKQNYDGMKFVMMIMLIMHISSTSITASAGATAARTVTRYIPTAISSATNQVDSYAVASAPEFAPDEASNLPSSPMYNYIKTIVSTGSSQNNFRNLIPIITTSAIHDYIKNAIGSVPTQQKFMLPSHDEFHIDHDLLTDKDIESFKRKFNDETDEFVEKLSKYWTLIKDRCDELIDSNNSPTKITPSTNNPPAYQKKMNRETVIASMKNVTEKVFDPNDKRLLPDYIAELKTLTKHLDPDEDKIIIDAIDFLQKNQHRFFIRSK